MLAAVSAQEIEVPCFDLTVQGGDMPNSVPPRYSDMWEPKQHTTLAKCSAKKQIRSAEKAISLDKVTSSPKDGFVLVLSKLAKRRMRAAAKVSKATPHEKNVSVHKTVASDSVPPDFAKAPYVEPTNQQAPLMFSGTSLEEWSFLAKRTT
jgi:hypothetical protein